MDNIQNKKDKFEKIKKATGSVLKFSKLPTSVCKITFVIVKSWRATFLGESCPIMSEISPLYYVMKSWRAPILRESYPICTAISPL